MPSLRTMLFNRKPTYTSLANFLLSTFMPLVSISAKTGINGISTLAKSPMMLFSASCGFNVNR